MTYTMFTDPLHDALVEPKRLRPRTHMMISAIVNGASTSFTLIRLMSINDLLRIFKLYLLPKIHYKAFLRSMDS